MFFFNDKHSPERIRWDDAAATLGLESSHRRGSRLMSGEIDGFSLQIIDLEESPPLLFVEVDSEAAVASPRFSIQLGDTSEAVFPGLRPVATGDLVFDHQLKVFAEKPKRILNYLTSRRREAVFELYDHVLLSAVTHEGLRAGLELPEAWSAEDFAKATRLAVSMVSRFYSS